MLEELDADFAAAADLTARIDTIRSQLDTLAVRLAEDPDRAGPEAAILRETAVKLEGSFAVLADSLVQQKPGGFFMWPVKLTAKLVYLANNVQSSDYRPTEQAREAQAFLETLLRVAASDYERLVLGDLAAFNRRLRGRGITEIVELGGASLVP